MPTAALRLAPPALPRSVRAAAAIWPVVAVVLIAAAFYGWTAFTSSGLSWSGRQADPLNLQTDAFLHGHTYLPLQPDPRLVRMANPYDPVASAPFRSAETHDLSLYHGRLYNYWGPTPVLALFLPYRAFGAGDLPPAVAALVFALVALVALVALMRLLVRRFLPGTPLWMQAVGAAGLAFGNLSPYLLRRPEVYEIAILAGVCFVLLGLLAILSGALRDRPSLGLLALGSLSLGVAVGARPPLALAAIFLVLALVLVTRRAERPPRGRLRLVAALGLPWAACLIGLAVFNQIRFGSPVDFGLKYQLSGYDQMVMPFFRLAYLGPGLWHYLIAAPLPRLQFPYWWLNPTRSDPFHVSDYVGYERTAGILTMIPVVWLLLLAPRGLRQRASELRWIVGTLVVVAVVLMVFVAAFFWGTLMRYETTFATLLLLAAAVSWFALAARPRRSASRSRGWTRLAAAGGTVLLLYGAVAGAAISLIGEDDQFRVEHQSTFDSLTSFFAPLPTVVTALLGHAVPAAIDGNAAASPQRYTQLGVQGYTYEIGGETRQLQVVSPSDRRVALQARLVRGPAIPRAQKLVLQADSADGSVAGAPVDGTRRRIPLQLHRGLNTVTLRLLSDRPLPAAQPSKLGEIRAEDIELVGG